MKKLFALGCALLLCGSALAADLSAHIKPTDLRTYGTDNKATLYVFSSLTCPHCAIFHKEIMPILQSEYVDKGKAKLVYVEMPYDPKSMTGSMISRCIASEKYEQFMDVMFENQATWMNSDKARDIMTGYAKLLGMPEKNIDSCLQDVELRKTILAQRTNLSTAYGVQGMPSIVVVKGGKSKLFSGTDKEAILTGINQNLGK